jgi:hypothetical protein
VKHGGDWRRRTSNRCRGVVVKPQPVAVRILLKSRRSRFKFTPQLNVPRCSRILLKVSGRCSSQCVPTSTECLHAYSGRAERIPVFVVVCVCGPKDPRRIFSSSPVLECEPCPVKYRRCATVTANGYREQAESK